MLVHEFSLRGGYAPLVSRWCLRRTPSRLGSARVSACWRLRRAIANFLRPFTAHLRQATAWRQRSQRPQRSQRSMTVRCLRVLRACQAVAVRRRLVLCGENLLKIGSRADGIGETEHVAIGNGAEGSAT